MVEAHLKIGVFLCHSSADKARVRELYRRLTDDGFAPWLDEEDLAPGENWELAIRKAVRAADYVLACLSEAATTRAGYVHKEIKLALDVADEQPEGSIYVVPVRLEACTVPDRLSHLHWVDLYADGGYYRLSRTLRGDQFAASAPLDIAVSLTRSELQILGALHAVEASTHPTGWARRVSVYLSISEATVRSHVRRLRLRLGARTIADVLRRGHELGLLSPTGLTVGARVSAPRPGCHDETDHGVYEGEAADQVVAGRLDGQQERVPMGRVRHDSDNRVHVHPRNLIQPQ